MSSSVSDRICSHLAQVRFAQLPAEAVSAARRSLLDAIGVMLGASGLGEGCDAFADLAQSGGAGPCTLLGYNRSAAPLAAALANGALAHALDFEDALDSAPCHPNAALVPVVLALAQSRGPCSGTEMLTAIAAGCDLVCRLALALRADPDQYGWYTPPILGAFGAAAAAGRLLQLSPLAMRDALSLTLCQSTCSAELKFSRRSVVRAIRDGFSAHAGLSAALLAERGVAGFEQPLEGRAGLYALYARGAYAPEELSRELGEHFHGVQVSFKPWPSCRGTHAFIEAALQLRQRPDCQLSRIARIRVRGGRIQHMLCEPRAQKLRPQTAIDAKFSIPFTVAAALAQGAVTLQTFAAAALADEQILALATKVEFEVDPALDDGQATAGSLEIALTDGGSFSQRVVHPRGHYSRPMSWDELVAKFEMCAALAHVPLGDQARSGLLQLIAQLEQIEDVGAALDAVFNPGPRI